MRLLPWLAAVALGLLACPSLLLGLEPQAGDHSVHLANAVEAERLLRSGRLVGWSDFQFAGYHANGFYPPLGVLLVAGLHLSAGGLLSWGAAYALVILGLLVGYSLAAFALLRPLTGTGGALAAAALLQWVDHGGSWVGGWAVYMGVGLWPFQLGVVFSLAAAALLPRVLARPGAGPVCGLGLLTGLALLAHPFSLILLAALGGLQLLLWGLHRQGTWRGLGRAMAAALLGGALAAWWLVPFLRRSSRAETVTVGPELLSSPLGLLDPNGLVPGLPGWVLPFALIGSWLAWRTHGVRGRWFALAGWGLTLASTRLPYLPFPIDLERGLLARLQIARLQGAARVLLVGLALYAVIMLGRHGWRRIRGPWARVATAVALCWGVWLTRVGPPTYGPPLNPRCYGPAEQAQLRELLESVRPSLGTNRLAVYGPESIGIERHCLMVAVPQLEVPFFKIGYSPSNTFGGKFSTDDPAELSRLGVSALLSAQPLPPQLQALPVLARRGRFEVRELEPQPRVLALAPHAQATVTHWEDERLGFQVQGEGETDVRLWVDAAPEWRAEQDGQRLPIQTFSEGRGVFMQVRARPGPVTLRFMPHHNAWVWNTISVLALGAMLVTWAGVALRRRLREARQTEAPRGSEADRSASC